ncbi:MAG: TonB-dependent receptor [Candidatus Omnitrophica bacterium]|nr:TonB-dependent receptor [Candidatus Omnitrophota bacterium]
MKRLVFALVFVIFCFVLLDSASAYELDLDKIVVSASKIEQTYRNVPANISIISSDEIESSNALEVSELLDMLPSVDMLEQGSLGSVKSVHTRGASNNQVLTLIDGRPVNTPRDGLTDFNQISLSNIERIEVMRGPAANMYGANAVGGVINIITKKGQDKMKTELTSKGGSFGTNSESFVNSYKIKNLDYLASYNYLNSQGHRDNAYYRDHNANAKVGYQIDNNNYISLSSGFHLANVGSPDRVSNPDLDDRTVSDKRFIDLTWDGKFLADQDILLKLYHNVDKLKFIEAFDPRDQDDHATKVYGADAQFSQLWFDIWRTTFGANYQIHKLNSSTSAKHDYNLKALYLESETAFLDDNLIIKFGGRWDDYSTFGDEFSPSVSAATWLFDTFKFHGMIAQSFRTPTFNDLYWPREDWGIWGGVEGNPTLTPEKAISYELGMGTYVFQSVKTDLTYFITKYNDLIEWTMDNSFWWRPDNVGKALTKGVELEAEWVLKDNLKLNFNYTFLDARNEDTDLRLTYRPKGLYKCKLAFSPNKKWDFGLYGRYKTKRYANVDNTIALAPYFVMDGDATFHFSQNLDILLRVTNIFNRRYQEQFDFSTPGFGLLGGIKLTF